MDILVGGHFFCLTTPFMSILFSQHVVPNASYLCGVLDKHRGLTFFICEIRDLNSLKLLPALNILDCMNPYDRETWESKPNDQCGYNCYILFMDFAGA